MIKFVDLKPADAEVRAKVDAAWKSILDNTAYIGGTVVSDFEAGFAEYCGVSHAIAVGNGTDALRLTMQALGVGAGDAVVTVPNTFVATITPAATLGATPLFVDIDPATDNMDPALLAEFLDVQCALDAAGTLRHGKSGARIAAIIPVHLYGRTAPLAEILQVAGSHGIPVVEDACQAHGALVAGFDSGRAGSIGRAGCFSFYPSKNLGAYGDGGAVVTNDADLAEELRWRRDHAQTDKYTHISPHGTNSRLDTVQAAVLSAKLPLLDKWNARREAIASRYREGLAGLPLVLPAPAPAGGHVYHLYVVKSKSRDALRENLLERGIETGLHYPIPIHLQPGFSQFGYVEGDFPHSETSSGEAISLPMYPHLSDADVDNVIDGIRLLLK